MAGVRFQDAIERRAFALGGGGYAAPAQRVVDFLAGRLSDEERRAVESVTARMLDKLLHLPTVRMKQAAVTADGVVYADAVRHLFGLGEEQH